ncbi:MAG: asparagine synthase (glutamine-hydrolyzing), partial [Acidobacteria bacterium]|nr:asparagine synthase (glutamine-hydrolyzing) [Acidobacteriota bacterium]
MCGILGYSHFRRRRQSESFRTALDSLLHRGPDQQSFVEREVLSLGAARLRIVDLDGGDQPLISSDGNVAVVFNGEIYNHGHLRSQLAVEGFTFNTRCDTELVLQAFRRWGSDCFARFRGMFAVAIWVESEGRLLLARDSIGIKPLYYRLEDGEIYFGSELKCILAYPNTRRQISLSGLNCFLALNYLPGPLTLVENIVKLMPGHLLEWRPGSASVRSFAPALPHPHPVRSLENACEELDRLLTAAVREQLVADVPVGIWLSGGLDSSTILYYAAQNSSRPIRTFSITFEGRSFDESRYLREVSHKFGGAHSEFDLNTNADLVGAVEQIAYYSDEPSADAGALPLWFLANLTAQQVTVVLSGEGSDELFAGYLTYQADRYHALAAVVPLWLRKALFWSSLRLPVSDDKIGWEYKCKRFLQGSLLRPEQAHVFWNGSFSEQEKRGLFRFADGAPLSSLLAAMNSAQGLERYLRFDQKYYLPDDILYKVDRMSMAHSLEARPPFLDPRIVDFASRLPERFKLHGSQSKYVLRSLMREKLPVSVLRRPKIGFDVPIHDWLRGALRPFLLDTLSEPAVQATQLFYWPGVKRIIDQHLARKRNWGYQLWGLMTLLIWMERWGVGLAA